MKAKYGALSALELAAAYFSLTKAMLILTVENILYNIYVLLLCFDKSHAFLFITTGSEETIDCVQRTKILCWVLYTFLFYAVQKGTICLPYLHILRDIKGALFKKKV